MSILSFMKDHGYIFETGLSGHCSYGPFGKEIKNNIENFFRQYFKSDGFDEFQTPTVYRQEVWEKSGHWNKFKDYQIKNKDGKTFKLDQVIDQYFKNYSNSDPSEHINQKDYITPEGHLKIIKIIETINKENIKINLDPYMIPTSNEMIPIIESSDTEWPYRQLMMVSNSGGSSVGLRPETATATFVNYPQLLSYYNNQLTIKIFQIGTSFRNELQTSNYILRSREFTQAEFQVILGEKEKPEWLESHSDAMLEMDKISVNLDVNNEPTIETVIGKMEFNNPIFKYYLALTYKSFVDIGLDPSKIRLHKHLENEMAFYALDAYDIEVNLIGFDWTEVAGIHDRGSYDLDCHFPLTKKQIKKKQTNPNIIEIAVGIDRLFYSMIDNLYQKKTIKEGKTMLNIPYHLAPIEIGIFPLLNKPVELVEIAQKLHQSLKKEFRTYYSKSGSIGTRYLKAAIKGIPYCLTIDHQTIEDQTVTMRDRDSEKQERIHLDDIKEKLRTILFICFR